MAMRLPSRLGGIAVARWAHLAATMPAAQHWSWITEEDADFTAAMAEQRALQLELRVMGLETEGRLRRTPEADAEVAQFPPTCAAARRDDAANLESRGRTRLQGRAGRLLDTVAAARSWCDMTAQAQRRVAEVGGQGAGGIFADHARDPRGWLPNHHFVALTLATLGMHVLQPNQRCGLRRRGGPSKGKHCNARLCVSGRHLDKCGAGWQTRLHNSVVRGLAQDFRDARLNADTEVTMADLHTIKPCGKIIEARMDIMVSRPGSVRSWPVDVRTIDSGGAHGFATLEAAMADACRRKRRRYRGRVWPLVVTTEGGLHHEARELLASIAAEAAMLTRAPPSLLERRWRRHMDLVIAFEWAEALRAAHREAAAAAADNQRQTGSCSQRQTGSCSLT